MSRSLPVILLVFFASCSPTSAPQQPKSRETLRQAISAAPVSPKEYPLVSSPLFPFRYPDGWELARQKNSRGEFHRAFSQISPDQIEMITSPGTQTAEQIRRVLTARLDTIENTQETRGEDWWFTEGRGLVDNKKVRFSILMTKGEKGQGAAGIIFFADESRYQKLGGNSLLFAALQSSSEETSPESPPQLSTIPTNDVPFESTDPITKKTVLGIWKRGVGPTTTTFTFRSDGSYTMKFLSMTTLPLCSNRNEINEFGQWRMKNKTLKLRPDEWKKVACSCCEQAKTPSTIKQIKPHSREYQAGLTKIEKQLVLKGACTRGLTNCPDDAVRSFKKQ